MNPSYTSAGKKVLIVDDEPGVILIVQRVLLIAGYVAESAADGEEAWRRFTGEPWDLVITDRIMPGLNGEELAERIKERAPHVPVIMITGVPKSVVHRDRFEAVLTKPFASKELLAVMARALGQPV
jgi:CheY-like chemotaxis protein